jgi:thioredoxin reductase (NADPH)
VEDFRGKRLLIVGGGDSAVDWANTLAEVTAEQTLIHRRDAFRAHEDSVAQMFAGRTRVLTFHELRGLAGEGRVRQATVYDNKSKKEQLLEVDEVLVNIGFESSLGPIAEWGLDLQGGQIVVDHTMMTNRPGIFAAGDVCAYPGKLKLLATGFGEACTAVNHAKRFLDPEANVFPGHSTNLRR